MIEVLKQMVEALKWCHGGEPVGTADAIQAGKKLIAELESQEPVAWKHDCAALLQNNVELWVDRCPHCGKPRTTHPPQRKPLTDKQIQDVVNNAVRTEKLSWVGYRKDNDDKYTIPVLSPSDYQFARAIEAAHGIKEES